MCASVIVVPAGNPVTLIWKFAVADVMLPDSSFLTVRAMVAVPLPLASALVMAGTSLAGESGTVKVDVVVVPVTVRSGTSPSAPDREDAQTDDEYCKPIHAVLPF